MRFSRSIFKARSKQVLAKVRPGLDNLALTDDDRVFISHFTDGGVAEIMPDGSERRLVQPGFCGPAGITFSSDDVLYACDGISMAAVSLDGSQRRVGMLFRRRVSGLRARHRRRAQTEI